MKSPKPLETKTKHPPFKEHPFHVTKTDETRVFICFRNFVTKGVIVQLYFVLQVCHFVMGYRR